jgi:hypothetical protein
VVGTLVLFLHVLNVAVIAVGIAAIDGALFCVMYVWGVPLDAVAVRQARGSNPQPK